MPEWIKKIKRYSRKELDEYQRFRNWIKGQYGGAQLFRPELSIENFTQSPEYRYWKAEGMPTKQIETAPLTTRTQALMNWQAGITPPGVQMPTTPRPAALGWPTPPSQAPGEVEEPQVKSFGGYDYELVQGEDGAWRWVMIGPTPKDTGIAQRELELEEWQTKANIWQTSQEREYDRWKTEQNLKAQQYAQSAERFGAMTRGEPPPDWAGEARRFEEMRNLLMQGLSGPGDWISRWQLQNQQNPYQGRETTPADEAARVGEEVKKWDAYIKTLKSEKDSEGAITPAVAQELSWAEQARLHAVQAEAEWQRKDIEQLQQYPTGSPIVSSTYQPGGEGGITEVGWGGPSPTRYTTPPTPSWLRGMYPQLGERLPERGKVQPLAPLSGQAWTALTPSQQAGWGGYARYAGASPEDLMALTQRMLPRTPYVSGRWSPARQMA